MDVDVDDDGTQRPKTVQDFGVEVDFESLDDDEREDGSAEALAEFDNSITKLNGEIERMAPNMKAMERYILSLFLPPILDRTNSSSVDSMTLKQSWQIRSGRLIKPGRTQSPLGISTMM